MHHLHVAFVDELLQDWVKSVAGEFTENIGSDIANDTPLHTTPFLAKL